MNGALARYLQKEGVWHRFISKPETIHTSDAAQVAGVELPRVTKNLVSQTDRGEYVLLVIPGDKRANISRVAEVLGVASVRLLPQDKAEDISGYKPGATPSVGHKTRMMAVVDEELLKHETVFCGGGSRTKLLELRVDDIIRLNGAAVHAIT